MRPTSIRRRFAPLARALAALLLLALPLALPLGALAQEPEAAPPPQPEAVSLTLLALNDLHGALDEGRTVGNRRVGGAAYLAAHLRARAADRPNVLLVAAGDMLGGSPPISALLRDEPTVRVLNALGLAVNAPGNHEFDRGVDEMLRLTFGGCHADGSCFEGARYAQVSANIVHEASGETLLPPSVVIHVQGVPVGFVGATHAGFKDDIAAGRAEGLVALEPAPAINRAVADLTAQGVRAIVVLIHEGGLVDRDSRALNGPIARTVEALHPEVDVVVSAHNHVGYAVRHAGRLVTQAFANGTAFADIRLTLDPATGDVTAARADLVTTYNDLVAPDPQVQALVDEAQAAVAPLVSRVVNVAAEPLSRDTNRAGESAIGNLVADAFRWQAGTQVGLLNSGGLRAGLRAGEVTWGDLFVVQPFGNEVVALTLSGAQLHTLFESQWEVQTDGSERFRPNQPSGLRVAWDASRPRGQRIISLHLEDGRPVEPGADYTVAVNSFMAGGGPGYEVLLEGRDRRVVGVDHEALVAYVERLPRPFTARVEGRLRRLG